MKKKESTKCVRLPGSIASKLSKISERTGMSLIFILSAAAEEWISRHAGPNTVAGKEDSNE